MRFILIALICAASTFAARNLPPCESPPPKYTEPVPFFNNPTLDTERITFIDYLICLKDKVGQHELYRLADLRWFYAIDLAFEYPMKQIYEMIVPRKSVAEKLIEMCMMSFDSATKFTFKSAIKKKFITPIMEGAVMVYLCEDFLDTIKQTGRLDMSNLEGYENFLNAITPPSTSESDETVQPTTSNQPGNSNYRKTSWGSFKVADINPETVDTWNEVAERTKFVSSDEMASQDPSLDVRRKKLFWKALLNGFVNETRAYRRSFHADAETFEKIFRKGLQDENTLQAAKDLKTRDLMLEDCISAGRSILVDICMKLSRWDGGVPLDCPFILPGNQSLQSGGQHSQHAQGSDTNPVPNHK